MVSPYPRGFPLCSLFGGGTPHGGRREGSRSSTKEDACVMGREQRNLAAGNRLTDELNDLADQVATGVTGAPAVLGGRSSAFASARVRAAVKPVIECLEGRQLLAGDFSVVHALPYALEFTGQAGGIKDA